MHFRNKVQELFYKWNKEKVILCREYLEEGKVLIVGHGLGFEYDVIQEFNQDVIGLDVSISKDALYKDKIMLYDGDVIPFKEDEFDTVICSYVLHHSKNPEKLFKELVRVSKGVVIITEETHKNFFQKLRSVINCWNMNRRAGQTAWITWSSYLHTDTLQSLIRDAHLEVLTHTKEDKGVHIYEFWILKK